MGQYDEILAWSRAQIATMTADIASMEAGAWALRENDGSGWVDITPKWIKTLKGRVVELEKLVAAYEGRNA